MLDARRSLVAACLLAARAAALSAAAAPRSELLRVPASDALCAETKSDLIQLLLANERLPAGFERLEPPELPHSWSDTDLEALQWEPLSQIVRRQREELAAASPKERRAHDLVAAHALACDGLLWLVPATAGFGRSAPRGAQLSRCEVTQHLVLLDDAATQGEDSGRPTISSGWQTNDYLLLNEGWADAELESDLVELPAALLFAPDAPSTPPSLLERRKRVSDELGRLGYLAASEAERTLVGAGGYCSDSLGRLAQAACLSDDEFAQFGDAGCAINIGEAVPLSTDFERRVALLLVSACDTALRSFPSTLAEDEALLAADAAGGAGGAGVDGGWGLDGRMRECVRSRVSRKRCFAQLRDKAEAFAERPTAMATLRRPWHVNIRTSG